MNVALNSQNNPVEGKQPHVKPNVKGWRYHGLNFATHYQSLPALQQTAQSLLVSTDVYSFCTCVVIASPSCFSVSGFLKKTHINCLIYLPLGWAGGDRTMRCSFEVIYIPVVLLELLWEDLKRLEKKLKPERVISTAFLLSDEMPFLHVCIQFMGAIKAFIAANSGSCKRWSSFLISPEGSLLVLM